MTHKAWSLKYQLEANFIHNQAWLKAICEYKPTKWGIKVFIVNDAANGYMYRLQVYTGKTLNPVVLKLVCLPENRCLD